MENGPVGATFDDLGGGIGVFKWTPQIQQIGTDLGSVHFTVVDDSPTQGSGFRDVAATALSCDLAGRSQLPNSHHDMDCDGPDEVMTRNADLMSVYKGDGTRLPTISLSTDWTVVGNGDFNADGYADALVTKPVAEGNATFVSFIDADGPGHSIDRLPTPWGLLGVGDFDANAQVDVLIGNLVQADGVRYLSYMNYIKPQTAIGEPASLVEPQAGLLPAVYITAIPTSWSVQGVGDVDGADGVDILVRNSVLGIEGTGALSYLNGPRSVYLTNLGEDWKIVGVGNFTAVEGIPGAGPQAEVLLRNGLFIAYLQVVTPDASGNRTKTTFLGSLTPDWVIKGTGDYNGDTIDDVLIQRGAELAYYDITGNNLVSIDPALEPGWSVVPGGPENKAVTALVPLGGQLGNLVFAAQVSSGADHSCSLVEGVVSCWGDNSYGQTDVPELASPRQITAGTEHNCALDQAGVICWGSDDFGQSSAPDLTDPQQVSAGGQHSCAVESGAVVCWGDDSAGQSSAPDLVNPVQVSAGDAHTCALDANGVVCWGDDGFGQSTVPELVDPSVVTAGANHSCALDATGVVCWGDASAGQTFVPEGLTGATSVSAGLYHSCAVVDQAVTCWGGNADGQSTVPTLNYVASVSAGGAHTCAVSDVGVVCWGSDVVGQSSVPGNAEDESAVSEETDPETVPDGAEAQ
jgi:hypothetical protein